MSRWNFEALGLTESQSTSETSRTNLSSGPTLSSEVASSYRSGCRMNQAEHHILPLHARLVVAELWYPLVLKWETCGDPWWNAREGIGLLSTLRTVAVVDCRRPPTH
jgi:hypothetical protein